jgi:predicted nucleic acid-binding protein
VAVSEIGYVEARSALARKEREGSLSAEEHDEAAGALRGDFREAYLTRPVTGEVLVRAGELVCEHALRAYDAVHLATAILLRDEL